MSWKGFTKAVARIPARLTKGVGATSGIKDEEFEQLEEQFKLLDSVARKLSSDTKSFKDSLSLMLSQQSSLAEVFVQLYEPLTEQIPPSPEIVVVREFAIAMKEARASLYGDLEQIERLVVAPSMDFIVILDQIKKAITKRNNKEIDYYRHGETIKQLNEKNRTINDEKKLAQTSLLYEEAKRAYLDIDARLKDDLKVFLSKKKDFIEPCLLTFYNYQIRVHQTLYNVFYDIASAKFDLKTSALDGYQAQKDRLSALLGQFTLCIPANINAEQISYVNESSSSSPVRPPPPVPLSHAETSRKLFVIALYDYTAQAEGDLSFKKDDKIEVLERKDDVNDWWVGRCGTIVGQFPGNYVQEL